MQRHFFSSVSLRSCLALPLALCLFGCTGKQMDRADAGGPPDSNDSSDSSRADATGGDAGEGDTSVEGSDTESAADTGRLSDAVDPSDVGRTDGAGAKKDAAAPRHYPTRGLGTPPDYLKHCKAPKATPEVKKWLSETEHCLGEGTALFEDRTLEAGMGVEHAFPTSALNHRGYGREMGGGVVLEDFTGDGWIDVYLTGGVDANRLLYNKGDGSFVDCTAYAGVGLKNQWTNGASAADYDNDGDQDLFVANTGTDRLYQNQGDGTFKEVTRQAGIFDDGRSSGASWGDLDGDGHLDFLLTSLLEAGAMPGKGGELGREHKKTPSKLYRNQGDGSFQVINLRVPMYPKLVQASLIAPMVDMDNDGDVDVLLTDEFRTSRIYRNVTEKPGDVRFELVPKEDGAHAIDAPMGVGIFDVNRDGLVDFSISSLYGLPPIREVFLENQGKMVFKDTTDKRGAAAMIAARGTPYARAASWGVLSLDVENDRDEDMYFTYGNLMRHAESRPDVRPDQPNALLLNDGTGHFAIEDGACAEDRGQSRGVARADLNGDGCVDLVVANQEGSHRYLRNRCEGAGHHLLLRLEGRQSNRDAIGARVTVEAGGVSQTEQVVAGSRGVHGSSPKRLRFGLGDAAVVEKVTIWWPSGEKQTLQQVRADQLKVVKEPM